MPNPRRSVACLLGVLVLTLAGCAHTSASRPAKSDTPEAEWQRIQIDSLQTQHEDHNARLEGSLR